MDATQDAERTTRPLVGYYYTDWLWPESAIDSMKSLLLFFDQLALVLPQRLRDRVIEDDPVLAAPLHERGILINLNPQSWLEEKDSDRIVRAVLEALRHDFTIQGMDGSESTLTTSHFGFNSIATRSLLAELRQRGLISGEVEDTVVRMDPATRLLILTALAALVHERSADMGLDLSLVAFHNSNTPRSAWSRKSHGELTVVQSDGHTISRESLEFRTFWTDLQEVGVDLAAVPLDEILQFRQEHGLQYRAYLRNLRSFVNDLERAGTDHNDILDRFLERREELRDQGNDLRRLSRKTFRLRAAILSVTIAATAWSSYHGDEVAALLSSLSRLYRSHPFRKTRRSPSPTYSR